MRQYGIIGSNWRSSPDSIMRVNSIWSDMKYTLNGKTYIIPATIAENKTLFAEIVQKLKANDSETVKQYLMAE